MDKVNMCLERIRVIRGVNYGIITYKQIQSVFNLYNLDEEQKRTVFESLKKSRVSPSENEVITSPFPGAALDRKESNPDGKSVDKDTNNNEQREENRKKRFDEKLQQCKCDIDENPGLASQYFDELEILKSTLAEQSAIQNRGTIRRISNALFYISNYRVREARKNGWVCGTYMSRVRERFERWIGCLFSDTELIELVNSCAGKSELNQHQLDMLTVLLHNTPKTLVHRYYTSL